MANDIEAIGFNYAVERAQIPEDSKNFNSFGDSSPRRINSKTNNHSDYFYENHPPELIPSSHPSKNELATAQAISGTIPSNMNEHLFPENATSSSPTYSSKHSKPSIDSLLNVTLEQEHYSEYHSGPSPALTKTRKRKDSYESNNHACSLEEAAKMNAETKQFFDGASGLLLYSEGMGAGEGFEATVKEKYPRDSSSKGLLSSSSKMSKGLRHFSMKVCQKVQEKGTTSYNEVADELVLEFWNPSSTKPGSDSPATEGAYDQKNIRRRVYDALNVLMAMGIISKERKEIKWIGLPRTPEYEVEEMMTEKRSIMDRIKAKKSHLKELILQHVVFNNLVTRNKLNQSKGLRLSTVPHIQLPFIIVKTRPEAGIECEMAEDRAEYVFQFDLPFEIHDDVEVMKKMGLSCGESLQNDPSQDYFSSKTSLPAELYPYLEEIHCKPPFSVATSPPETINQAGFQPSNPNQFDY
eukprot:Sdes_comp15122_c0_seq1m3931